MRVFTLATAWSTPLPPYRFRSPSRSSSASPAPVEAPLGTAARPTVPSSSTTSASTVGLPRESRISRARMRVILLMKEFPVVGGGRRVATKAGAGESGSVEETLLLDRAVECRQGGEQRFHPVQGPGIGAVGQRPLGVRVGLHEQP